MKKACIALSLTLCFITIRSVAQKVTLTITSVSDCKPLSITASASASGFNSPIESYEWNFGDGIIITQTNKAAFTFLTSGVKNISVTVKAGLTIKTSAIQNLTVEDLCIEDGNATGGNGGFSFTHGKCDAPFTVQFKDDFSSKTTNYSTVTEWDFGDNTIATGSAATTTISHTYLAGETKVYFVTVKRKDKRTGQPLPSGKKRIIIVNEAAKFSIKNDITEEICTETRINFINDGMHGIGIKKFEWDFGDTKKYTVNNTDYDPAEDGATSHQYNIAGSFVASLKITDRAGCTNTYSFPQNIRIKGPKANFTNDNIPGCGDFFSKEFTDQSTPGIHAPIEEWKWYVDNFVAQNYTSQNIPVQITLPFTNTDSYKKFNIKLIVRDADGCPSTLIKNNLIEASNSKANFGVDTNSMCAPLTLHFTNSSHVNNNNNVYLWKFGNADSIGTTKDVEFTYQHGGDYNALLRITDSYGCEADKQISFKINGPYGKIETPDSIGCVPYMFKPVVSGTDIDHIKWDWNDNTYLNSTELSVSHIYGEAGVFTPVATLYDANGCSFIPETKKKIIADKITANFNIDKVSFCDTGSITVIDKSIVPVTSAIKELLWDFGDGSTSTEISPGPHLYTQPGEHSVELLAKSKYGCTSTSERKMVTIHKNPGIDFTGNEIICLKENTPSLSYLSAIGTIDSITDYSWKIDDVIVSDQKNLAYDFRISGPHHLELIATTDKGCPDTIVKKIVIDSAKADFSVDQNIFCGSGDPSFTNSSSSVSEIIEQRWSFGDNPTEAFNKPGIYPASLYIKNKNGCASTSKTEYVTIHDNPHALIEGEAIICLQKEVAALNYKAAVNSVDQIATYLWKVNKEDISILPHLKADFRKAGIHELKLIVTTNNHCSATATKQITIDSVKADFSVIDSIRCGDNRRVEFKNMSANAYQAKEYVWQFGDGSEGTGALTTHAYSSAGNFPVTLQVSSGHNCVDKISKENAVVIYEKPGIVFRANEENCVNKPFTYTARVFSEDVVINEQLNIYDIAGAKISPPFTAGTYNLSYIVNTKHGCNDSVTRTMIVHPLPQVILSNDTIVCKNSTIQLHASGAASYLWTTANTTFIQNPTVPNPVITPNTSGRYFVHAETKYGCAKDSFITVRVDEPVDISVSPAKTICEGETIKLRVKGKTNNFLWNESNTLDNTHTATPIVKPQSNTTYIVKAISNNVCPDEIDSVLINVAKKPTLTLSPDMTVFEGEPLTLQAAVTGDIYSYNWKPVTGLSCIACATPTLIATNNILYSLEVSTKDGCKASDQISISVLPRSGDVYIPDAFTPNADGKNDVFYIIGNGIQTIKSFSVFDRFGKMVFHKQNSNANDRNEGWNGLVNAKQVSQSTTFVYLAEVLFTDGKSKVFKGTVTLIR